MANPLSRAIFAGFGAAARARADQQRSSQHGGANQQGANQQ
jgi:hypothetical protein